MDENELDLLAQKISEKLTKKLLRFSEVAIRIGYAPDSSSARSVIFSKSFPKPTQLSENGRNRWFTADVDSWIEKQRLERAKIALSSF